MTQDQIFLRIVIETIPGLVELTAEDYEKIKEKTLEMMQNSGNNVQRLIQSVFEIAEQKRKAVRNE